MKKRKKIGITMGDPNGIGPEVIVKSIKELSDSGRKDFDIVVYGSQQIMQEASELVGWVNSLDISETGHFTLKDLTPGKVSKVAGKVSLACIEQAAAESLTGDIDAIVTAPISKESIHMAGSPYPGHTEMLRDLTNAGHVVMMFDGGPIRVALVTIHIPLSQVPRMVTFDEVLNTIRTCNNDLVKRFSIDSPEIALCGLNPHAGESGAFGREEIEHITPAVLSARKEGINVSGPFPADTVFYHALKGRWDLVIAMYHDQGLIPFKMLAFEKGVNVTLGLPVIRTSPDHGTAYDIAWTGNANPESMTAALSLAAKLAENK